MSSTGTLPRAQTMKPKLSSPAAFIGPQLKKNNTVAKALVLYLTLSPPLSSSYLYFFVCFKVLTHRERICFVINSLKIFYGNRNLKNVVKKNNLFVTATI